MPQPIIIEAESLTDDYVISDVLDTRGVGSLALAASLTAISTPGPDEVNIVVFTRKAGLPWGFAPVTYGSNAFFPTVALDSGVVVPMYWAIPYIGILDETIVIAWPGAPAGTGTGASFTTSFGGGSGEVTFSTTAFIFGSWGNLFSITLEDPGAINSPLSISSPDGYESVVSLETNGTGAIITTAGDLAKLFSATALNTTPVVATADTPGTIQALPKSPLVGGTQDPVTASFTITGSY